MTWHEGTPDANWDKKLFSLGGHFTQSSHWAEVQKNSGKQTFYVEGENWQCLAILETGKLGRRIYAPYGPTVKNYTAFKDALVALKQLAKDKKAVYVRLEPVGDMPARAVENLGLKKAPKESQPHLTWVKDLTKSTDELIGEMTATNRNLYRNASKKGLTFKSTNDPVGLPVFLKMMHEVASESGIKPHSDNEFKIIADTLLPRGVAKFYFAFLGEKPIASAFVYDSPNCRYYAHAAAYREFRNLHAGSPLLANMIIEAKKNGQSEFDFFGIAPPNKPNHPWAGFSKFKHSFGGDYKEYLGTWELPVKKLHYRAYKAIHKIKKLRG